ncbi:hypothetical protein ACHAXH_000085, partial [Discostella pseudostelligera]
YQLPFQLHRQPTLQLLNQQLDLQHVIQPDLQPVLLPDLQHALQHVNPPQFRPILPAPLFQQALQLFLPHLFQQALQRMRQPCYLRHRIQPRSPRHFTQRQHAPRHVNQPHALQHVLQLVNQPHVPQHVTRHVLRHRLLPNHQEEPDQQEQLLHCLGTK